MKAPEEPLRNVEVTRYVTPFREGGSLPALIEADDLGMYVLKFRGAGQGRKSLVAEVITGELARSAGLPVPELVLAELDPVLARSEPDPEIQDLIRASAGLNLGMDYLPGSLGFDPLASRISAELAARILWFDAFTTNVDRTPDNANLLLWHGEVWVIDHGASLYFHHSWADWRDKAPRPFPAAGRHVLLPFVTLEELEKAGRYLTAKFSSDAVLRRAIDLVPDTWLAGEPGFEGAEAVRGAYLEYLKLRLGASGAWQTALAEVVEGAGRR